jgi:hypothetical protein
MADGKISRPPFFCTTMRRLLDFLEVENGQVHLAFRDDVDGENGFAGGKMKCREGRSDVPMVPLTPGHRIGCVIGGHDGKRAGGGLSVDIERDGAAAVGCVEQIGRIVAGFGYLYRDVEPFAGNGPADIEQIWRRHNLVVGVVVDFRVEIELGIGSIDALLHAELIQVGSVGWIEPAAAIIFRVGVMVGHAFSSQVVVGAEHLAWNGLRASPVVAVVVWDSFVVGEEVSLWGAQGGGGEEHGEKEHRAAHRLTAYSEPA